MKQNLVVNINNQDNEKEYYNCTKSGKKIDKNEPVCPTPNTYCKYRTACIIFDLYKDKLKKEKKE